MEQFERLKRILAEEAMKLADTEGVIGVGVITLKEEADA